MESLFGALSRGISMRLVLTAAILLVVQTSRISAEPAVYEVVSEPTLLPGTPVPEPTEPVILRVDGRIDASGKNAVAFDLPTLERLGLVRFKTKTNWTAEPVEFEGILLSRLLEVVGADPQAENLTLTALNDYRAPMPAADARQWPVILALKENGAYMSRRERGPLWVVYPQHAFPELGQREYLSRWVWQLTAITVE